MIDRGELAERLTAAITEHDVPGAALGVLQGDEVVAVAGGVVNLNTGVETTTDTVFQIGSQGKTWTATVVMGLVDEGLLDLDTPIRTYLSDFAVADPDVSESV